MKRIFILLGHPDKETFSGSLADTYESAAALAGHEVRRLNIGELEFDPILHKGYKEIQELEPDLKKVQENMKWADHFVILYPNWWCSMPALLKGMFDRMFLPGFAFTFGKTKHYSWEPLLKGKTAHVIVGANAHPRTVRFLFGDYTNEISRAILGYAGYAPVRITKLGPVEKASASQKERWLKKVSNFGKKAT